MKKLLIFGALSIGALVSAKFNFRTSCGQIVAVSGEEGMSTTHLTNILESMNYAVCGETAQIVLYTH
ncbi:hypothetical protein [Chryseobacterium herbae]|uniref:Uncharacterized protein n=1 Tax=Chryseobacterium herbae TaxID=2976476 RepID=A0ABT2IX50_9FLAO|nr:hypothetical protein [Chryseobacterium sp. pc1-10]MCT2563418.1 hypothetical protein [Chryseobacterium sp. pc1-10]